MFGNKKSVALLFSCLFLILAVSISISAQGIVPPPSLTSSTSAWTFQIEDETGLLTASSPQSGINNQYVCSDGMGESSPQFFCQLLGKPLSGATYYSATAPATNSNGGNSSIAMRSVSCESGYTDFSQCTYDTSPIPACTLSNVVALACRDKRAFEFTIDPTSNIVYTRPILPQSSSSSSDSVPPAQGDWKQICAFGFDPSAAAAICSFQGLPVKAADFTVTQANASIGFWLSRVSCPLGSGTQDFLHDCTYTENPKEGCVSNWAAIPSAVVLLCQNRVEYNYRIQENTDLLLVTPVSDNQSSLDEMAVCDEGFGGLETAQSICQASGLPTSDVSYSSMEIPTINMNIGIQSLDCVPFGVPESDPPSSSSPTTLSSFCSYRQTNVFCSRFSAITISCNEKIPYVSKIDVKNSNILVVRDSRNASAPWQPVCAADMEKNSQTVDMICSFNELPYGGSKATTGSLAGTSYSSGTSAFAITRVECSVDATEFSECLYHTPTVGDSCDLNGDEAVFINCAASPPFEIKIDDDGLLLARQVNSDFKWGPVCYDGFTSAQASIVCRLLGLPSSSASFHGQWTDPTSNDATSSQQDAAAIGSIKCPTTASNFSTDCNYTESLICAVPYKLALDCFGYIPSTSTIRIDDSSTTQGSSSPSPAGRLLYRPSNAKDFGSVCSNSGAISQESAAVVCRALVLGSFANSFPTALFVAVPQNKSAFPHTHAAGFQCAYGDVNMLSLCQVTSPVNPLYCSSDLAVVCTPQVSFWWTREGYLLTRPSPKLEWTPIAFRMNSGDAASATAICNNMLGQTGTYGEFFRGKYTPKSNSWNTTDGAACSIMTSFACPSTANVWADCFWYFQTYADCYSEHVGIRCLPQKPQ